MYMLRLIPVEFLLRGIPESFLIVMVIYIFSNKNISKASLIKGTIIFSTLVYLIRLLPIVLGVHTILATICFVAIAICVLRIPIVVSIFSILVSGILISICELINSFLLVNIFKIKEFTSVRSKLI